MFTMLVLLIFSAGFGVISTRIIGVSMAPPAPTATAPRRARGPQKASSRLLVGLLLFGSGLAIAIILALRWVTGFIEKALS